MPTISLMTSRLSWVFVQYQQMHEPLARVGVCADPGAAAPTRHTHEIAGLDQVMWRREYWNNPVNRIDFLGYWVAWGHVLLRPGHVCGFIFVMKRTGIFYSPQRMKAPGLSSVLRCGVGAMPEWRVRLIVRRRVGGREHQHGAGTNKCTNRDNRRNRQLHLNPFFARFPFADKDE